MFIRLTTLLCASLYLAMVIFGTEQPGTATAEAAAPEPVQPVSARGTFSPATEPLLINANFTASPEPAVTPAVAIEDVSPAAAPIPPAAAEDPAEAEDSGLLRIGKFDAPASVLQDKGIDVVEVSGTVVNLRAGPSTGNDIVGTLRRGARAELIETAENGWMRIRDLDSGAEGYMSGKFLARVTPG